MDDCVCVLNIVGKNDGSSFSTCRIEITIFRILSRARVSMDEDGCNEREREKGIVETRDIIICG